MTLADDLRPRLLHESPPGSPSGSPPGAPSCAELRALLRLREAGLPLAPLLLVPAAVEERFYRLNNLPAQLLALFRGVDPSDPDDDEVEEAAPRARALLRQHFLLDEFIDAFYEAAGALPPRVRVRRPGSAGREVARGRPALLALKGCWEDDWRFETLMARLLATGSLAVSARPVLLHAPDQRVGDPAGHDPADANDEAALAARAAEELGAGVGVWASEGRITRLELPTGDAAAFRGP